MKKFCLSAVDAHKKSMLLLSLLIVVYLVGSSFKSNTTYTNFHSQDDSVVSKAAFLKAYDVLMSPRCMNCHPAGDIPLVGDASEEHGQGITRGKKGNKCGNCHMDENIPGVSIAPSAPNWRMPPADMKMIFQGKTPRQLAVQLLDTATNGHKTTADLIKHVKEDGLVLYGWNPGDGRKIPPMSHAEFVKQFELWISSGAYLPAE
jgi:hypothetical protein